MVAADALKRGDPLAFEGVDLTVWEAFPVYYTPDGEPHRIVYAAPAHGTSKRPRLIALHASPAGFRKLETNIRVLRDKEGGPWAPSPT